MKSKNSLKPVKKVTTFKLYQHVLRASGLGDFFHQGLKLRGFVDREIGQNLAVQLDVRLLEPVHELAVVHIERAAGRIDAHDPETAVLLLLLLAALVRVNARLVDRIVNGADVLARVPVETLGAFQRTLARLRDGTA